MGETEIETIDLGDIVASRIRLARDERGEVNEKDIEAIGRPNLNRFAHEQQGATELISGIGGIYIADRRAGRLFRTGSLVMSGIRQLPGVRAVAAMDKQYHLSLQLGRASWCVRVCQYVYLTVWAVSVKQKRII